MIITTKFLILKVTKFTSVSGVEGSGDLYYQTLEAIENPNCKNSLENK